MKGSCRPSPRARVSSIRGIRCPVENRPWMGKRKGILEKKIANAHQMSTIDCQQENRCELKYSYGTYAGTQEAITARTRGQSPLPWKARTLLTRRKRKFSQRLRNPNPRRKMRGEQRRPTGKSAAVIWLLYSNRGKRQTKNTMGEVRKCEGRGLNASLRPRACPLPAAARERTTRQCRHGHQMWPDVIDDIVAAMNDTWSRDRPLGSASKPWSQSGRLEILFYGSYEHSTTIHRSGAQGHWVHSLRFAV